MAKRIREELDRLYGKAFEANKLGMEKEVGRILAICALTIEQLEECELEKGA